MIEPTAMTDHVKRYVAMQRALGYRYHIQEQTLSNFADYADNRNESTIRTDTVITWIEASKNASHAWRVGKLRMVRAFACWMHAEDPRHQVPSRDTLGRALYRRATPYLLSAQDTHKILSAALDTEPVATITPLTWHYLFGLIAATGIRISEALSLTFDDLVDDGLVIRGTKFKKSRMVVLHPTVQEAIDRYLMQRRREKGDDKHLFVISTGRPPSLRYVQSVFNSLVRV